mmetsp:Transcript_12663/g.35771  ORF Transcript_12663/g.35771 Transcript_12663/m.35771 type:complete len:210 (-) Transcript_12663:140-769(-)
MSAECLQQLALASRGGREGSRRSVAQDARPEAGGGHQRQPDLARLLRECLEAVQCFTSEVRKTLRARLVEHRVGADGILRVTLSRPVQHDDQVKAALKGVARGGGGDWPAVRVIRQAWGRRRLWRWRHGRHGAVATDHLLDPVLDRRGVPRVGREDVPLALRHYAVAGVRLACDVGGVVRIIVVDAPQRVPTDQAGRVVLHIRATLLAG